MTRRLAVLLLAVTAVFSVGLADLAWACSCLRYDSAAEQLRRSDAVFRGRVVETRRTGPDEAVTTFVVVERLKGRLPARVKVRHGTETGGACGVVFTRGQTVAVIVHRGQGGRWATSSCSMPQFPWAEMRRAARAGF